MASVTVQSPSGKKSSKKVDLSDELFGIEPNVPVMHQVVTAQLAARRAGTQSTKTRAEVRGGGAKPWRQKGTGRARQGSIRSPQWRGGGVALGPKPRSYVQRTPKKMIRLALRSALSDRAAEGKVVVIDDWGFDAPTTKGALSALAAIGVENKVLVVLGPDDEIAWKSFRNLGNVQLITATELNAYDVLCNDWVVFTTETLPAPKADADDTESATKPADAKAPKAKASKAKADETEPDETEPDEAKADDETEPADDTNGDDQ